MPVPNWSALGRASARFVWDRLLRSLLALGAMATGVTPPGWYKARGEQWWEGAAPSGDTGPRSVIAAGQAEPTGLDDAGVLRILRALRATQNLSALAERSASAADAAPYWHPERRPAGGS